MYIMYIYKKMDILELKKQKYRIKIIFCDFLIIKD